MTPKANTPSQELGSSGVRSDGAAKPRLEGERTFTVVFRGDLARLGVNPFAVESPFGKAVRCGFGDAFDERDSLEGALQQIELLPSGSLGRAAASFHEAVRIAQSALWPSEPQPRAPLNAGEGSRDDLNPASKRGAGER